MHAVRPGIYTEVQSITQARGEAWQSKQYRPDKMKATRLEREGHTDNPARLGLQAGLGLGTCICTLSCKGMACCIDTIATSTSDSICCCFVLIALQSFYCSYQFLRAQDLGDVAHGAAEVRLGSIIAQHIPAGNRTRVMLRQRNQKCTGGMIQRGPHTGFMVETVASEACG